MVDCFLTTLKTDGISKGLYAGTVPALATNVLENSVLFLCYGFCQKFMAKVTRTDDVKKLSMLSNATAGFLAAFFSSIAITPTELIKCKLQASYEVQKLEMAKGNRIERLGPIELTLKIFKTEGTSGLFRGLVPTLLREMPGYFFFFGAYEGTRELLRKEGQNKEDIGLVKTMTAGAVGGASFWTATFPIDVAKSRIQVNRNEAGLWRVLVNITRTEGVMGLYNGLGPTLVRTVPATAALFVTYEYSKMFMLRFS